MLSGSTSSLFGDKKNSISIPSLKLKLEEIIESKKETPAEDDSRNHSDDIVNVSKFNTIIQEENPSISS